MQMLVQLPSLERIEIFQNRVTVRSADVSPDYIVYVMEIGESGFDKEPLDSKQWTSLWLDVSIFLVKTLWYLPKCFDIFARFRLCKKNCCAFRQKYWNFLKHKIKWRLSTDHPTDLNLLYNYWDIFRFRSLKTNEKK